ncbi:MAG: hypothetical protein V4607_15245 [Pseudomonadota bacterium]
MIHVPALAIAAPLMMWGMYRRVHRNIARQKITGWRLITRSTVLGILFVVLLLWPSFDPVMALAEVAGVIAGALFAILGLRLTRFEQMPDGHYFTPNAILGVAVSMLFVGRMIYRIIVLYPALAAAQQSDSPITAQMLNAGPRSALTIALLGIVIGYFCVFCLGVLRTSRRMVNPVTETVA